MEENPFFQTAHYDGEFDWDAEQQGIILGSFVYGYIVTNIPGKNILWWWWLSCDLQTYFHNQSLQSTNGAMANLINNLCS